MHGVIDQYFNSKDKQFQKDLEEILRAVPSYLDIMIMMVILLVQ
jgi:hypothetical protein